MRNRNHGFVFHHLIQALLDGGFHFRIQRAGGFVEQQNRGIFQHHAGDGDALTLAAGKFYTTLADVGVIAGTTFGIGKLRDKVGGFGTLGSLYHFLFTRIGAAVHDVVAYRTVQQAGVLGDQTDLRAQAFLGDVVDVLAVDADVAALRFVKTQQQVHQSGLARAAAAD